jgi:uncharacterized coiled-coil protein SlyX
MNPEEDPKKLQKKIAELESHIAMQDRLISVLREMPGCRDASIPMEEAPQALIATRKDLETQHATKTAQTAKKGKTAVPTGVRNEGGTNSPRGRSEDKT